MVSDMTDKRRPTADKATDVVLFPFQINLLYVMFRKSGEKIKKKRKKKVDPKSTWCPT